MKNVTIQGATYEDVPQVKFPSHIEAIPSTSVSISNTISNAKYGQVSGYPFYIHEAMILTVNGTDYYLPIDSPNPYDDGYTGYGATVVDSNYNMDFTTYPYRLEKDDNDKWRIYNAQGGTFTVSAKAVDTAVFTDVTETNAEASDVALNKYFFTADGTLTLGTASGGGSSAWTKVGEITFTTSTTSTSAAAISGATFTDSSLCTKDKIVYVRVRDTAGARAGYFYGSDSFFINYQKANGSTSTLTYGGRLIHRYSTSSVWSQYSGATSTGYGVYPYDISSAGRVRMYQRYNSNYSLTVNGTYKAEFYLLDFPDGIGVYD